LHPPPSGVFLSIQSIYSFSENAIWFGFGSLPIYYNGETYYKFTPAIDDYPGGFIINAIWGTSSNNVYFVGGNGSIVHYDGLNFVKMESGTEVDLNSITGTGPDNVWISERVQGRRSDNGSLAL
tara:strand:- start:10373 stop:10744 length:372 start_codon:yes stop_codon:yes gene_type:complete